MSHTESDNKSACALQCGLQMAMSDAFIQIGAVPRETDAIDDLCVARTSKVHQAQATTGLDTTKAKKPVGLIQRDETAAHTTIEVPQSNISVLTALMDDLSLATEDGMTNVPLSSDEESDDSWSVVSEEDDFVVIDPTRAARHSTNDKSKEGSELPRTPSKLQARPSTPNTRQQSMEAHKNDHKEPVTASAVYYGSTEQIRYRQQCAGIRDADETIGGLDERQAERERALQKPLAPDAESFQDAYRREYNRRIGKKTH
jgi:hypothetical protein